MAFPPPPSSLMLSRTIEADAPPDVVSGRIGEFLVNCGYRREGMGRPAKFSRGIVGLTPMAFTPRGWRVEVTADLTEKAKGCAVEVVFRIDTTGQTASEAENEYWAAEMKGLEDAILTGRTSAGEMKRKGRAALWNNLLTLVLVLGLPILFMTGAAALGELIGNRIGTVLLISAGAVAGFFLSMAISARWLGHFAGRRKLPPDDSRSP